MKKLIWILVLQLPTVLYAQRTLASLWAEVGVPTGEFRQNTEAFGLGMGGGAYFSFDANHMFYLGGELSFDIYGKHIEDDGFYEIITNNNMFQLHGVIRIKPPSDGIVPYIDGMYGFKYIYTVSKLKENIAQNAIARDLDFQDVALSYGGAVGLYVPIGDAVAFDFKVQYLKGGEAEYIDARTIREEGIDNAVNNPIESSTDMFFFKVGLTFGF